MMNVCLWSPGWSTDEGLGPELAAVLPTVLAELAPRIRVETRRVWVDGRGLPIRELTRALVGRLEVMGVEDGRAGVAAVPVAAELAVRAAAGVRIVDPGTERAFLAPLPLTWLESDPRVLALLEGVGIETCGELAARERGAVEVRFGAEGARLWRLACADDPRRLFGPIPPERTHASLDFVDYVVTDPERLVFTANALLGGICDALRERGEHARSLTLRLSLGNGASWSHRLESGRSTASRAIWLRLARAVLERLTVPDAVAGMALEVEATEPATAHQGDLFDTGFATASAVEAAVLRLVESQGEVMVRPAVDAHPLAERRTRWEAEDPSTSEQPLNGLTEGPPALGRPARQKTKDPSTSEQPLNGPTEGRHALGRPARQKTEDPSATEQPLNEATEGPPALGRPVHGEAEGPRMSGRAAPGEAGGENAGALLTLQLLSEPRMVRVEAVERRDHALPVRYRDREGWHRLVQVLGPDRVSGERWEESFAREYYRAVREDGVMVWLFRDAVRAAWHLHGWWD